MKKDNEDKKELLLKIMATLGPMYPDRKPFLDFETPFQLLVATLLSARCTDAAVNKITPELFRRFPDPIALSNAPIGTVENLVHSTGSFRVKAHNIKTLSRMLVERHNSEVPDSMEALTTFPGVGRKTAGVVLSVIFGKPAICVDTHFSRVAKRVGLSSSERAEEIEQDIADIAEREDWITVSNVLNRFGRAICHARMSDCEKCPVKKFCTEQ